MEMFQNNWLLGMIILPVLISIFKTELGNLLKAWKVYRLRSFDVDGNPATSDCVQLLNGALGEWEDAKVTYKFSMSPRLRGVYITYPDGGKEKLSLLAWADMRKRVPPQIHG